MRQERLYMIPKRTERDRCDYFSASKWPPRDLRNVKSDFEFFLRRPDDKKYGVSHADARIELKWINRALAWRRDTR